MRTRSVLVGLSLAAACTDPAGPDPGAVGDDPAEDMSDDMDTPVDDPSGQACAIRTRRAGVIAVLHGPDGSVNASTTTDATGKASFAACPSDALVSYAFFDGTRWRGVTVGSVQPGDDLEVLLDQADAVTTAKFDVPTDAADVVQARALAGASCAANTTEGASVQLAITKDCIGDAAMLPLLVTGKINSSYVYSHGTAAMSAGGDTVVSNLSSWMTGYFLNLSATNINAPSLYFMVQPLIDGRPYGGLSQLAYPNEGSATENVTVPPVSFANTWRVGVSTTGAARRGVVRATTAFGEMFDMGYLLPEVTSITVNNAIAERPVFTIGGALTSADVGVVHATWVRDGLDVDWRLVYPAATTSSITFPALPAELAAARPTATMSRYAGVFDVPGSSYTTILAQGYLFGEFQNSCGKLAVGSECWFSTLSIQ